jgi:hypothetical protein
MKAFFILILLMSSLLTNTVTAAPQSGDKQQAVQTALKQFPGRVLSVKQRNDAYLVKILNDRGEVRIIKIPTQRKPASTHR